MSWWLPGTKLLNRLGVPYPLLNHIVSASSNILVEIKFEVTDRCNLACSFCHQDFGAKGGTEDLDREVCDRVLAAAKTERIRIVRLTGGEPLVLKSTDEFLRRAKEMGFCVIVNTNATPLTEKRLRGLRGLLDCFKVSLPAADEHAENIRQFDDFFRLLEPHETFRWKLLRAEPQEGCRRPVSRDDIRSLAACISQARNHKRWKDLTLGLATPFCALENPFDAVKLFSGGRTCGPVQSLTVTTKGTVARCYSRRDPVDPSMGLRKAADKLAVRDFDRLPPYVGTAL